MDDLRDRFSRLKKDVKHRLGLSKRSGDKPGPGGREESVGSSTSFPIPEPPSRTDEDWATYWAEFELRAMREEVDALGPLKSVAFILENCERTNTNKQTIESLAPRVKELAERLHEPISEGDVGERKRRKKLKRKLEALLEDLDPEGQGNVEGFFNNNENVGQLGGFVEGIRYAMMEYQTSLQQGIYAAQRDIDDEASVIMVTYLPIQEQAEYSDFLLFHCLDPTANAVHLCGNRQGCLKGTRNEILKDIGRWFENEESQPVFWLNGLAGTGKSTIAQSFAETTFENGKLGASFFCSRDFEDRSNLQKIFPTIAFQLAWRYPDFRQELLEVLRERPNAGYGSLCSQMEMLLVRPLKATKTTTLIIIDALDECKDDEPASALLSILSRYIRKIPTVKFFITGRPKPRIPSGFQLELLVPITEVLKLHEVKPEAADGDIELFFRTQLTSLAKNQGDLDLTEDWPSSSDIKALCDKAAGFFIYASTVVKFVASEADSPTESLSLITSLPQSIIGEGKSGVDRIYTQILQQAFSSVHPDNSQRYHQFQTVVGAVLLLFNPLSITELSDLLGCSMQYIQSAIQSLHSLLLVPGSIEEPIQVYHKSFPDFLMDPTCCEDEKFIVEPVARHAEILLACLRFMEERLKRNICSLDDFAVLSDVRDPSTHKKVYIGDGLEYACKFWTKHLLEIPSNNPCVEEVQRAIDNFFTVHLLHWVEVLAITGNLGVGIYAMNDIQQWYNFVGVVSEWANDGQHFLLEHFDTIENSPSHIYHSALPLSPSSSWLYKHYIAEASPMVKVVKGPSAGWRVCSKTTPLGSYALALSHHGNSIAVGSKHGDIIILNTITGSQSSILSGHTRKVNCVVFSSDGTWLVSGGYDGNVGLWDIQTGCVANLFDHKHMVWSVSISADSTTIASGSTDEKIRLWNVQTGECYHTIQQQDTVYHVKFSLKDPQHLISVSGDKVWQWDANGCQIEPEFYGTYVAFSSDGAQFVSCFRETVTVYDYSFGAIVTEFQAAGDGYWCCFSPDSRLVAVAVDTTAYCWDITTSEPQLVETFIGHTDKITSLVFSSSTTLVTASKDKVVKFWQIRAQLTDPVMTDLEPAPLLSAQIESVTLQSKEGVAFTCDSDGMIRVWDISAGICKRSSQTPANYHHKGEAQLVNGRLIYVWYTGKGVHVWDVENGGLLWEVDGPWDYLDHLRISGDGSKVFGLHGSYIWVWSILTGELVGKMYVRNDGYVGTLIVDGSKVWACRSHNEGWDFGFPGSAPMELSNQDIPPRGNRLWAVVEAMVKNLGTKEVVFQLSGRFANPAEVQCDDSYLIVGYWSGEVLILDLRNVK